MVNRSKPLQPPRQAEQPCGKRAVFATDLHCFSTGLHSNLCAWPSHDLQFHPLTLQSFLTLSFPASIATSHSKRYRQGNLCVQKTHTYYQLKKTFPFPNIPFHTSLFSFTSKVYAPNYNTVQILFFLSVFNSAQCTLQSQLM